VSQQSQPPYPVLGDSLPEPIQEQLNSLLREAPMGQDRRWKHNSPLPLFPLDKATQLLLADLFSRVPDLAAWDRLGQPTGQANRR